MFDCNSLVHIGSYHRQLALLLHWRWHHNSMEARRRKVGGKSCLRPLFPSSRTYFNTFVPRPCANRPRSHSSPQEYHVHWPYETTRTRCSTTSSSPCLYSCVSTLHPSQRCLATLPACSTTVLALRPSGRSWQTKIGRIEMQVFSLHYIQIHPASVLYEC